MLASIVPKFQRSPTLVWYPGFLKLPLQHYLECLYAPSKTGSKAVVNHPGRQKHFSRSPSAILKFCKNSLRETVRPSDGGRSMRAVKNNLPAPAGEVGKSEGLRKGN